LLNYSKLLILKSVPCSLLFSANLACAKETSLSATNRLHNAKQEFYQEKSKNPYYRREYFDINYNIRWNPKFAKNRRTLTTNEAWQGVMEKASNPIKYIPYAIIKGIILQNTLQEDDNALYFVRISLQRPFIEEKQDEYTVVREEVSIDKINKIVYFMGRTAESSDYKMLGVDPQRIKPQVLFLDEHKIVSIDNEPLDSWTLVTLPTQNFSKKDQQLFVENLGKESGKPENIYLQTQKLF